jgi:DNA primase
MYTRGQGIDFITKVFGEGSLSNQGANISVVCPICVQKKGSFHTKRKLVIRTDNFLLHCWSCGYKSRNLVDLIRRFHSSYFTEYLNRFVGVQQLKFKTDIPTEIEFRLPNGFHLLAVEEFDQKLELAYRSALNYIAERFNTTVDKLDRSLLWYWKFGISLEDKGFINRVIMPSFTSDGELNYFTGRSYINATPKYMNPQVQREDVIFNELNLNWNEPITIVEGPFDLIKCNLNATCLLGSEFTTDYKLFLMLVKHKTPVILALDPDAKDKALKIADLLTEYDVPVSILDIPKPYKDVGELSQSEFNSLIDTAIPFSRDYLLRAKISKILKV